jgi:hypothetical protein
VNDDWDQTFTLSLVAAGALVMAFNGSSHARGRNTVPTSAFCNCAVGPAPRCSPDVALITPGKNQVFELTDVTIASPSSSISALDDGSSTKEMCVAPATGTTVNQA